MAQLSDDCFAFGGPLLRLDAALDDLAQRLVSLAAREICPLAEAAGRVLAQNCLSAIPIPAFDNSAVDGYAVRFADLAASGASALPAHLRLPAGPAPSMSLPPGEAARIFTGAALPMGADTIFMQEDVREEGGRVFLPAGLKPGSNRRLAGEDFLAGATLVAAGERLRPQHIAALAAAGFREVMVRAPLTIGIFSTGNEIVAREAVAAPEDLPKGCHFDANRPMLAALLLARGLKVRDLGILPDDRPAIAAALRAAARECDVLLTSGGVSTGEEDHVKAAIEAAGSLDFWRLAIKPGRPIAMGRVEEKVFLGMPGNPAAVFVTFLRFVGPVLDMLAGAKPIRPRPFSIPSGFDYRKKPDRREYVRAALALDGEKGMVAQRFAKDGAALISSLVGSEGLVELEEARRDIAKGEMVAFLPYSSLLA